MTGEITMECEKEKEGDGRSRRRCSAVMPDGRRLKEETAANDVAKNAIEYPAGKQEVRIV